MSSSPEVLTRRLNTHNFNEFKSSDIYSYALVLWEIVNKVQMDRPMAMIDDDYDDEAARQAGPMQRRQQQVSYSSSSGIATGSGERGGTSMNTGVTTLSQSGASQSSGRIILPYNAKPTLALLRYGAETVVETGGTTFPTPTSATTRPYRLPYEGMVENDPSFDQMRRLVVDQGARPSIDTAWLEGNNVSPSFTCEYYPYPPTRL